MIVFCFTCFCCRAVCSALCPASVTLNATQTHSYAWHAHNCLRGFTFEDGCVRAGAILCSPLFCVFTFFTLLLFFYLRFVSNFFFLCFLFAWCGALCVFALSLISTGSWCVCDAAAGLLPFVAGWDSAWLCDLFLFCFCSALT
ncbi:mucin-associated surface protein (MASP), putative, partial [Trypanosoma cruzi]